MIETRIDFVLVDYFAECDWKQISETMWNPSIVSNPFRLYPWIWFPTRALEQSHTESPTTHSGNDRKQSTFTILQSNWNQTHRHTLQWEEDSDWWIAHMQSGRRIVSFANQGGDVGVGQGDVSTGQRDDTNTRRRHNHKTQSRKSRPSQRWNLIHITRTIIPIHIHSNSRSRIGL